MGGLDAVFTVPRDGKFEECDSSLLNNTVHMSGRDRVCKMEAGTGGMYDVCDCMNQHQSQILLTFTAHKYSMYKHTCTCISYTVLLLGKWEYTQC